MKAKILFFIFFFVGITSFSTFAQNSATQGWDVISGIGPVYCDGIWVDNLIFTDVTMHFVKREFKKGSLLSKEIRQVRGTVTSQETDEVFTIIEINRLYFYDYDDINWDWTEITWHFNAKGNLGSHYTGTITYNDYTDTWTLGNIICN